MGYSSLWKYFVIFGLVIKQSKGDGMSRLGFGVVALVLLSGCASITSESTQLVRVDALDEAGKPVKEAACELINDRGVYKAEAGKHTQVGKSGKNLNVECVAPDREDKATGTVVSRAGAGMFGNIIFGGGIGAIIDHNKGTAYNYPDWIQVVFGKVFLFDRNDHKDGVPLSGKEVNESTPIADDNEAAKWAAEGTGN